LIVGTVTLTMFASEKDHELGQSHHRQHGVGIDMRGRPLARNRPIGLSCTVPRIAPPQARSPRRIIVIFHSDSLAELSRPAAFGRHDGYLCPIACSLLQPLPVAQSSQSTEPRAYAIRVGGDSLP
jgi:hypothetical protein